MRRYTVKIVPGAVEYLDIIIKVGNCDKTRPNSNSRWTFKVAVDSIGSILSQGEGSAPSHRGIRRRGNGGSARRSLAVRALG